jgi:transposase
MEENRPMMGRLVAQEALFYEVRLEERVPPEHFLRRVDAVLDLGFVHAHLREHYSLIGRPSIDPELMIRMLLVGYLYGIRSERRLCEDVDLNLAFRWFCRLGLDGRVPDHSSFTKNRYGRFRDSDLMRRLFEEIVQRCLAAGLAQAQHLAVDGSFVQANASHERRVPGDAVPEEWRKKEATRPVREYLEALDAAASVEVGDHVQHSTPKHLSVTDPAAAWSVKEGPGRFAYGLNALVDTEHGVVLDIEAAPERRAQETRAARTMLERTCQALGPAAVVLTADKAYGNGAFLNWLLRRGITPHVPVIDARAMAGDKLHQDAFAYDGVRDAYRCPGGHWLRCVTIRRDNGLLMYRSRAADCRTCQIKPTCTNSSMRTLMRSPHEQARAHVRELANTDAFRRSLRKRKRVELLFAHIKDQSGLRRLRLRGLRGAAEQFLLAATVQNLRRLIKASFHAPLLTPA